MTTELHSAENAAFSNWHEIPAPVIGSPAPAGADELSALMMVAHDLRGPLSNLGLLIESIAVSNAGGHKDRVTSTARKAEVTIDHLHALFSSILQRARSERDPLAFDAAPVQLPDVLETVVALNEPAAQNRNVRLHCYSVEPLEVWGDEHLLHEAIDNLVSNAIKHTRPGGLVLCEAAVHEDDVLVRIADEGPGLTDRDLARAFRPFTRLSSNAKGASDSFGLGLWITRLIAERHGGKITARNNPRGQGSTFTLYLPGG